jgi:hypothetical protein
MKRVVIFAVGIALLIPGTAQAAPQHTGTATPGAPYNWNGTRSTALNISGYNNNNVATCGTTVQDYCDFAHVRADLPFPANSILKTYKKTITFTLDTFDPAITDFDMAIYSSNAAGDAIERLGFSGANPGDPETFSTQATSTRTYNADGTVATENITSYFLVEVVYFAAVNATYHGRATF